MAQERVLIIDEDILVSEMLKDRLEALGFKVSSAQEGKKAFDFLKREWVDVVIMEVVMSYGMNGFQFLRKIKKHKKFSKIPVIIHSSHSGMKKTFEAMGAGAFFSKPCSTDKILAEVKRFVRM